MLRFVNCGGFFDYSILLAKNIKDEGKQGKKRKLVVVVVVVLVVVVVVLVVVVVVVVVLIYLALINAACKLS